LGELVEHDNNGLVFSTEVELEQQLEVISRHCTGNISYTLHVLHINMLLVYACLSRVC